MSAPRGSWIRRRLLLGVALVAGMAVSLLASEELQDRVGRLHREGHHDLALALIDDHVTRGTELDRSMQWLRARLTPDPDRFDRLSASLVGGQSVDDSLVQSIVLERAKELFARGQYIAALENLDALPRTAAERLPEIPLFRGMAAAAAGQARQARETLEAIPEGNSEHASAQALLAGLNLKSGDARSAAKHARNALDRDARDIAPQALYAAALAQEQLGEAETARASRVQLLRSFPQSVEAAWVREGRSLARDGSPVIVEEPPPGFPEEEAPQRRLEFSLQFGAFHDRVLALRMAERLGSSVRDLRIERDASASPPWYRVVGGRFPSRSQADAERARLGTAGHEGVVLSPGQEGP